MKSAPKPEQPVLSVEQTKELSNAFRLFKCENEDVKGDVVKAKDLKMIMRALGFEPKKQEITDMLKQIDVLETGTIDFKDFTKIMGERIAAKDIKEEIGKAFRMFDEDSTGKISLENLQKVAAELGECVTEEELRAMIQEADLDKDGQVDEEEFMRIMKKTSLY